MITKEQSYKGINDVKDEVTRRILYREFVQKYYPRCYNALLGLEV